MAGNHSNQKVKTLLLCGSILLLSISTTAILGMKKTEEFKQPSQEDILIIMKEIIIKKRMTPPKKQPSLLTSELRNSTEKIPKKPKLNSLLREKLDSCFKAIRSCDPKKLKKKLVAGISPDIIYDGYEKSLFQAQNALWQSIQNESHYNKKQLNTQSILSILLQRDEENDNAKK